jgi:NAD(P)-dependent dehydrogenase (short-subunit alcohol dehydrogenase family)
MLAAEGHTVSVVARRPSAKGRAVSGAHYWSADLTDSASLRDVVTKIVRQNGKLRNLIFFQRYRDDEDDWHGEIETSLTGTKNVIDLAVSHFEPSNGSIVIVSSVIAYLVAKNIPLSYHLGKAGLNQLVRYYAVILGQRGIRVNTVSPGTVLKEESKNFFLKNKKLLAVYRRMVPLGRLGTAEEVVKTVMFLCSDSASFITGQNIVIDGGLSLQWQEALVRDLMKV